MSTTMMVFYCLYVSLCQIQPNITLRKVLCLEIITMSCICARQGGECIIMCICNLKKKKYQVSDRFLDLNFNVNNVNNAIYIYGCAVRD